MAVNILPTFRPGQSEQPVAPIDEADYKERRRIAAALMQAAMKQRRIEHPLQGAAQMAEAALAGYDQWKLENDWKRQQAEWSDTLKGLAQGSLGGGTSSATPAPTAAATPPPPPPSSGIPNSAFNAATLDPGFASPDPTEAPPPPPPAPPPAMAAAAPPPMPPAASSPPANLPFAPSPAGAALSMGPPPAPSPPMPSGPGPSYAGGTDPSPQFTPRMAGRNTAPSSEPMFGSMRLGGPQQARDVPRGVPMPPLGANPEPPRPSLLREGIVPPSPTLAWTGMEAPPSPPQPPAPPADRGRFESYGGGPLAVPRIAPPPAPPTPPAPNPPMPMPPGIMDAAKQTAMAPQPEPPAPPKFDFTDFSAGRGGRPLDRKMLDTVVAHDTSGVRGRLSDPQNLKAYHFAFDDKGAYRLLPEGVQAPHAAGFNPRSLSFAYRGMEGSEVPPQAIENGARIARYLMDTYGMTPEQFKAHPALGAAGTRSGGKDPREAAWLPTVLERAVAMKAPAPTGMMALGAAPEGAPPTPPPAPGTHSSNADRAAAINSGAMDNPAPIRLAQAGGQLSPEMIDRLSRTPQGQALLGRMVQQKMEEEARIRALMMQRNLPPTEAEKADLEYKRAQTEALRAKPQMQFKEVNGKIIGISPDGNAREIYGQTPEQDAVPKISGGLNNLARIPENNDAFENAVGPLRGDPNNTVMGGLLSRLWGSMTSFIEGDRNSPTEVRSNIQASAEALAAQIKPFIRKPGEGAWSDADQARLNAIVGDLTTADNKAEYMRRLEAVRQRIIDNFGVKLPPISGASPAPTGAPRAGDVVDGWRFKGGNPADRNNWERR